uniref:Uncharacterized protein n=1 Tax=Timema bartmani TaxID=61472 RepID=A0A7R9I2Z9_9NEOP|nr:unnamed protein product [Timema bartmani]
MFAMYKSAETLMAYSWKCLPHGEIKKSTLTGVEAGDVPGVKTDPAELTVVYSAGWMYLSTGCSFGELHYNYRLGKSTTVGIFSIDI